MHIVLRHAAVRRSFQALRGQTSTRVAVCPRVFATSQPSMASKETRRAALLQAREEVTDLIRSKNCHPIILRAGWHDAGTYDKNVKEFPQRGGATGSIRFHMCLAHNANKGLDTAVTWLKDIADKYNGVSNADLIQLAAARAVELAGGPHIPVRSGRKDAPSERDIEPEGRLPAGGPPWPNGEANAAEHLRNVFYRMGLNDQQIVVLSGGQTLGRCHPERSGFGKPVTKYTAHGPGKPGGSPWTPDWLTFNNDYFQKVKEHNDPDLVVLDTDAALFEDERFRPWAELYAADEAAFFRDYVPAHLKLSELGAEWELEPFTLEEDEEPQQRTSQN